MPQWNNQFAAALRNFLTGEAGRVFIEILDKRKPKIKSESIEKAALSAHAAIGYEAALTEIESMANFREDAPSPAVPFINT